MTETTIEPRQPKRSEKNANMWEFYAGGVLGGKIFK
jgi:hypothetical protein